MRCGLVIAKIHAILSIMWQASAVILAAFCAGSVVTTAIFAIVHLIKLPLVEIQLAALVRYRVAAAKHRLSAEIAADGGGSDADTLGLAGQTTQLDPKTGKHTLAPNPLREKV